MKLEIQISELEQACLTDLLAQVTEGRDVKCNGIALRELASVLEKVENALIVDGVPE